MISNSWREFKIFFLVYFSLTDSCTSSQINSSAGASVQEITGLLRSLQPLAQGDRQRRVQADRLHNEFQATASRFAEIQKVWVSFMFLSVDL